MRKVKEKVENEDKRIGKLVRRVEGVLRRKGE